jgi:uncharacterized protein YjbI with pentapeptide repeats
LNDASLPEVFKSNHDLRELTADPLLNYLVVLSGFHENLASDTDINRNRIYARLLKDVLDRRHAKKAQTDKVALGAVDDAKDRDNFERLLETVALAAWYGDGRTTTRADIEKLLPQDLKPSWQELVTGGPGFTRLIAAFYIRQTEASADAVEFTHKSFGEYLTARRLVREIGRISKGRRDNADFYSDQQALADWARLTSSQAISMELLRFLRDDVALHPIEAVEVWQPTLTSLFNLELRNGFPLAALASDCFREAERRSRNSEEALLAALNACARVTKGRVVVEWPDLISAGDMLHRLRRQRDFLQPTVMLACLEGVTLEGQNLYCQDLFGANLSMADLTRAHMTVAHVNDANLSGVSLQEAQLWSTFFVHTNFSGADLSRADLTHSFLIEANLSDANLSGADLTGADLREADFSGADLSGANLSRADLTEAKQLTKKQIESAQHITGAKLPAYLKRAGPRSGTRRTGRNPIP